MQKCALKYWFKAISRSKYIFKGIDEFVMKYTSELEGSKVKMHVAAKEIDGPCAIQHMNE